MIRAVRNIIELSRWSLAGQNAICNPDKSCVVAKGRVFLRRRPMPQIAALASLPSAVREDLTAPDRGRRQQRCLANYDARGRYLLLSVARAQIGPDKREKKAKSLNSKSLLRTRRSGGSSQTQQPSCNQRELGARRRA